MLSCYIPGLATIQARGQRAQVAAGMGASFTVAQEYLAEDADRLG